jgi:CBS-domain-containing membrane protein
MIPLDQYPHLPYWFTLRQAMAELMHSQIDTGGRKSMPRVVLVFDETYQLLGTVRRRDILRGLEPPFLTGDKEVGEHGMFDIPVDPSLSELSYDKSVKTMREHAERPVSEVMQPIVATINREDHLVGALAAFVEHDINLLPVLEDGKVVGVLRTIGVFNAIAELIL